MTIIDWCIFIIPLLIVMGLGIYCRRYVKSVVDFLAGGRVAGRYVLTVSCLTDSAMGLLILIGMIEQNYKSGFALGFWWNLTLPLGLILALTGFVTYRYREMKVLSFGQFIEERYHSKVLRIYAAVLRSTAEIMASMLAPALAARFFIYFFGFPGTFTFLGMQWDTYIVIIAVVISLALILILCGGVLGLMVTDCLQGLILYPCLFIMVIFICSKFSWFTQMAPVLADRAPGESFLNPYDVHALRDFNLFNFLVALFCMVYQGASWMGGGSASAAKSAHEQKMAGILGRWARTLFYMFAALLSFMVIAFFNHGDFADQAKVVRDDISNNIVREIMPAKNRKDFTAAIAAVPVQRHIIGRDKPLSNKVNLDTPHIAAVEKVVEEKKISREKSQEFTTLYHQLMLPFVLRHLLPVGLLGMFALMMVLMMLSTDDTRIYCSGSTIAQDIILPLLKKAPTPKQHLLLLKGCCLFVGICFFVGSVFMKQLDYINLFVAIVCSIWMGGCAPVMLGGLYCKYGNKAGAWCSLISGMILALGGLFLQRNWADLIYPWLEQNGYVESVANFLTTVSKPMTPLIVWEMSPKKFPINSIEIYAFTMIVSLICYVVGTYLTYKGPYNMDKLLHRGIYNTDNEEKPKIEWRPSQIVRNLVGITPQHTKSDRILAWFTFYYSFGFSFGIMFVAVAVWNIFSPWPILWWSWKIFIGSFILSGLWAFISTFVFTIGGWIDLFRLFRDLKKRKIDDSDNGMVYQDEAEKTQE